MNMQLQPGELLAVEPVPSCWYLLDVYPGRERDVMRFFGYYHLTGWYPLEVAYARRSNGEPARRPHLGRRVVKPLVPGLIFVADIDADQRMLSIPCVDGFHRIGPTMARLSAADMATLRDIEAYLNAPRSGRGKRAALNVGDSVRIVDGPFASFVGQIDRLDSRGRLRVFIDAVTRGASVSIDEAQVEQITDTAIATGVARRQGQSLKRST